VRCNLSLKLVHPTQLAHDSVSECKRRGESQLEAARSSSDLRLLTVSEGVLRVLDFESGQGAHAHGAGKVSGHAISHVHWSSHAVETAPFWGGNGAILRRGRGDSGRPHTEYAAGLPPISHLVRGGEGSPAGIAA
jgi:hypothetical protein